MYAQVKKVPKLHYDLTGIKLSSGMYYYLYDKGYEWFKKLTLLQKRGQEYDKKSLYSVFTWLNIVFQHSASELV